MKTGKFITLEGGEGVGKSTNLQFIQQYLQTQGVDVCLTREPGGTPFAERIRGLLLDHGQESVTPQAELLLVFAARAQHLHHFILPRLRQGQWVLCDRFTDATYAYQGAGRHMDSASIAWLENTVQADLRPDLTVLLDAPVAVGMQRAQKRGELDRFETERSDFFERVRNSYLQQAQVHPQRYRVVDASQSLAAVQAQIALILDKLLQAQ
jgi:dTMP kinase